MAQVDDIYRIQQNIPSDVNQHFGTLKYYTEKVDTVVEFGFREGVSTWALLAGRPKKLTSYDIQLPPVTDVIPALEEAAKEIDVDFKFCLANTLHCTIDEVDLLFIDTLHAYSQITAELERHSDKVKKYIICHDVVTWGNVDESYSGDKTQKAKQGIYHAINDFIAKNNKWSLREIYFYNNGLAVLERV